MPTVLHRLSRWAETDPHSPAQKYKSKNGSWETLTARDYMDRVFHLALFLESRGFGPKDVLCILAYNSPWWVHMDLAGMLLGGKSAGIYPNASSKDLHYILDHTEASVLGVQNREYYEKITAEGKSVPAHVKMIVVFDNDTSVASNAVAYQAAIEEGRKLAAGRTLGDYLGKIDPKAGAFLIYTSGTTGNPKGALMSHDNLVFTSDSVAKWWKLPMGEGTLFSFLPLCHIAEKLQNVGVGISQRYTACFCTKFESLSAELAEVQPTLLLSVPRLWEKMMDGVMGKVRSATGVKKVLAEWALATGARVADARYSGRFPNPADLVQLKLADKLVLQKVRHAMGLGRAVKTASGAAALAPHISRWFRCLGLEILEDYGQTESTGVITMTEIGIESAGTVGKPVSPIELKIAEDGEILCRGRNVFVGYHKDEAATAATITDGWLHTGDLGEITERGQLRIKGRKKEVLKTSNGKMVAPLPIEETLKAAAIISQVCVVGDGRKYLSALVTLSESTLAEIASNPAATNGRVLKDARLLAEVQKYVDELNSKLAGFEQIKKFTVLSREFSIVDGEMTPTLKMKRNIIESRYRDLIDAMY